MVLLVCGRYRHSAMGGYRMSTAKVVECYLISPRCRRLMGQSGTVCEFVFFFSSRRRHTRFDCDWSSDVCSSDLTARFQQLFENAPMGIVVVDQDDFVLDANEEFEEIFKFSLSELRGRRLNDRIVPAVHAEEGAQLSSRTRQGEIVEKETVRQRKDGTLVPVQLYGVPIVTDQEAVGVFAIYLDLTERKRMEAERETIAEVIQGAITTSDLDEFLKLAHHAIGKYLYAENCFVALYDEATELMHFPFWVDKLDPCPEPRPVGIGFSSYVLRTGRPMLVSPELTEQMYQRGEVQKSGSTSASWLDRKSTRLNSSHSQISYAVFC